MKPDKTTVYDLFDRQRRYAVPLYQRQYVWTEEAQWIPLWDDIAEKARAVQVGQAKAPHFLGAIVTSQRPVFGGEMGAWDIIDGQQRLTTLQVVLTAFHDVVRSQGETAFDRDMQRITRNEGVMKDPATECFKVWPTNTDRSAFQTIMKAGSLNALMTAYPGLRGRQKRRTPRLAEAYAFFFRTIERFLAGIDPTDEPVQTTRAQALFETFRRHLQIVNIELEADDDPQVIFESLNGRGVPLLPSDLVRNFVFMRAAKTSTEVDGLYNTYWRPYDDGGLAPSSDGEAWWKIEERQGRLKRPRLDLFIFHYLQYRLAQEVNIGHLFQEFRSWWDGLPGVTPDEALAEMQRYSKSFAGWLEPTDALPESRFARMLSALDTSTAYPLMFLLFVERAPGISAIDREGIAADLESYLVRRAVCGLTNKQYNRFFISLLTKLRTEQGISRDIFRKYLSQATGDSVRWPNDEEFGRAFVHRQAYRSLKRELVAAILRSLEGASLTSKHEKIQIDGKLSIEHVMPQEWEKYWPMPDESDEMQDRRERLLHSFGNLTLVTGEFNTSLSNKGFDRKQKELKRITRLLISRSIEAAPSWDEAAILSRGKDLFELARRWWPHSASSETFDKRNLELPPEASWNKGRDDDQLPPEPPLDLSAATSLLEAFRVLKMKLAPSMGRQLENE